MSVVTDAKPTAVRAPLASPKPAEPAVFDFVALDEAGKFAERKHLMRDTFEYPRDGNDPGLVLIFNQECFEYEEDRIGTRRDVNELVICLQRQGFNIGKDSIMHNGTANDIKDKLKQVAAMDLSDYNSLLIFFLTHGREGDTLLTYNSSITTFEVWKNFLNCKHLENKPKLFVFQACKGNSFSTTQTTFITDEPKFIHSNTFSSTYLGPDMLVVYSTLEGNVSYRSTLTGSWFVQELCKNITAYGKRDDVFSIITRTSKCVSGNYYHHESGVNKKQMPVCMSTLSKKFYLNLNKDRSLVVMSRSNYEGISGRVKQILELLDERVA